MKNTFAIFDMDGTLVDSMGYWNRLADEYGRCSMSSLPGYGCWPPGETGSVKWSPWLSCCPMGLGPGHCDKNFPAA